jgi:leucyl/phenylalanyl-tRNA--protein transferase
MRLRPFWLDPGTPWDDFPDPRYAMRDPNGLLAVGGDLAPERLLAAYRRGIFPWYNAGQPVLWWSPDPRAVLYPEWLHVSRSLRKTLRRGRLEVTVDGDFRAVMEGCAAPRRGEFGTWITPEMLAAYTRLHDLGWAHSWEVHQEGELVGGLYGVAIGSVFFGESMFSRVSDASKVALAHVCAMGYALVDCQVESEHLARMGARAIPRTRFLAELERWCPVPLHGSPAAREAPA